MFLTNEELRARRWRKLAELLAGSAMILSFEAIMAVMFLVWGM